MGPMPGLGQDFFPSVDAGQLKLHLRAPTGTRIEETAILCDQVEKTLRETIKPGEITSIVDNLGLPYSGINLAYTTSAPVGPGRCGYFHQPRQEALELVRLSARAADQIGGILPLHPVRVPAGGHRQPDLELRPALAARRAGDRAEHGCEPPVRREAAAEATRRGRRGGPAHPAAVRLSPDRCRRRSQQGAIPRLDPAERRLEPAHLAVGQLSNHSVLLDRSEERHSIQRRGANSAISS